MKTVAADVSGIAEIPVTITNNSGIAEFRFKLDYDPAQLEIVSIEPNRPLLPDNFQTNLEAIGEDGLLATWYQTDNMTLDGTLFTIKARLKEGFNGNQ